MTMITLPCRHIIIRPDRYDTCTLNGSLCQACNPNLTDITIRGITRSTEVSLTGNPDKGNFEAKITDCESEVLNVERPEDSFDLDIQCPAGYTWEQVQTKWEAVNKLLPKYALMTDNKDARRVNALIHDIHKTNIMETDG